MRFWVSRWFSGNTSCPFFSQNVVKSRSYRTLSRRSSKTFLAASLALAVNISCGSIGAGILRINMRWQIKEVEGPKNLYKVYIYIYYIYRKKVKQIYTLPISMTFCHWHLHLIIDLHGIICLEKVIKHLTIRTGMLLHQQNVEHLRIKIYEEMSWKHLIIDHGFMKFDSWVLMGIWPYLGSNYLDVLLRVLPDFPGPETHAHLLRHGSALPGDLSLIGFRLGQIQRNMHLLWLANKCTSEGRILQFYMVIPSECWTKSGKQ